MSLKRDLAIGEPYHYWHDTGCFGWTPVDITVVKLTPKFADTVDEFGRKVRKSREYLMANLCHGSCKG